MEKVFLPAEDVRELSVKNTEDAAFMWEWLTTKRDREFFVGQTISEDGSPHESRLAIISDVETLGCSAIVVDVPLAIAFMETCRKNNLTEMALIVLKISIMLRAIHFMSGDDAGGTVH